jgi:hypothetical protein
MNSDEAAARQVLDQVRERWLEANEAFGPLVAEAELRLRDREARIGELSLKSSRLADALSQRAAEQDGQSAEQQRLYAELAAMRRSQSWRITLPLRRLGLTVRALRSTLTGHPGEATSRLIPLRAVRRWRSRGARLPILQSGLFDDAFYRASYPGVAQAGVDPLVHYLIHGVAEGRDPNPLFDTSFYLQANPDVARSGINPLLHYVLEGAAKGRDPNPLFDTSLYLEDHQDALGSGLNPLAHYLSSPGIAQYRNTVTVQPGRQSWNDYLKQLMASLCCYTTERKAISSGSPAPGEPAGPRLPLYDDRGQVIRAVVVVSHDAEFYGAQLIALSVVKELLRAYDVKVFVILKMGGPLRQAFEALAPTILLQDERSQGSIREDLLDD